MEFISAPRPTPFAGAPTTVADQIQRWFEARASTDSTSASATPRSRAASARRSCRSSRSAASFRTEYEASTLRGNLGLPVPENRYTKAREQEAALLRI